MPIEESKTTFVPSEHGWHFGNHFKITEQDFGPVKIERWGGGLCGGMCFTALDRYFTGRNIADMKTIPMEGTPLFEEILRRQIDSLWPDNWKTFLKMVGMQDSGILPSAISVGYMTKMQISELRKSIDKGIPKTLGLICNKWRNVDPSNDHQVLAIGYTYETKSKEIRINIYDPKYPDENDLYLFLNLGRDDHYIGIYHSRGPWCISENGTEKWKQINCMGCPLTNLAFGDFTGNGKTDVFRTSGESWYISENGIGPWVKINASGASLKDLAFADFTGDGKTDVFYATGSKWYLSKGGVGPWIEINRSKTKVSELVFADFTGNG
ncbi:MAG: VCBS repeat-containing protein, partial [Candidatus Thermoplasmatota archaeon]|nr:VCBS repeat-containing protein [Candidatus Thermoplasmatota archaeon]